MRLYLCILVLPAFTRCGSDIEMDPAATGMPVELIAGRWKVDMILTDELKKLKEKSLENYRLLMSEMVDSSYMDFQLQDSIYIGRFGPDLSGGKWEISNDSHHIIISEIGGGQQVFKIIRLKPDSLELLNLSSKSLISIELSR